MVKRRWFVHGRSECKADRSLQELVNGARLKAAATKSKAKAKTTEREFQGEERRQGFLVYGGPLPRRQR
jgi:hypothetical protein